MRPPDRDRRPEGGPVPRLWVMLEPSTRASVSTSVRLHDRRRVFDSRSATPVERPRGGAERRRGGDGVRRRRRSDGPDGAERRHGRDRSCVSRSGRGEAHAVRERRAARRGLAGAASVARSFRASLSRRGRLQARSRREERSGVRAILERGGLLVMDDMTPNWPGFDPVRAWAHSHPGLQATEVLTTPETSAMLVARI